MKVAVMGSGGVGGYFGARLAAAGFDVTFIARGVHLTAIRAQGLKVESPNGSVLVKPAKATDDPGDMTPVDCVLFATKLWDTESAAEMIRPLLREGTAVVSLQNGIDSEETLAGILGRQHVMGATAQISSVIVSPGLVAQTGTMAKLTFGELDGRRTRRAERLLDAFRTSEVDAHLSERIRREIWHKFVFLVALSGTTCVTRRPIGAIREDADARALLRRAMAETAALARAEGIDVDADIVESTLTFVDGLPPDMTSSMYRDLTRGRRLELDWLSGSVVRLGRKLGLPTPTNEFLYAALKPSAAGYSRTDVSEKGAVMPARKAHARWEGSLEKGKGEVGFGNGTFEGAYSFGSRFEEGAGSNPEELLGAAHASCFAMALALILGQAGFEPEYVDATAHVTVAPQNGGFRITKSRLVCAAKVPGLDDPTFQQHAEAAKAGCPVSQALAGIEIALEAKLIQRV